MKTELDEYDLSFSKGVWSRMLYENISSFKIDIYHNERGFPGMIHDSFGAKGTKECELYFVNTICEKNQTDDIWQVSSFGFAILSKPSNCGEFELDYKGVILNIKKRTIEINLLGEG